MSRPASCVGVRFRSPRDSKRVSIAGKAAAEGKERQERTAYTRGANGLAAADGQECEEQGRGSEHEAESPLQVELYLRAA